MTIKPEVLRAMQSAGASIDIIIAAIEADAAGDDDRRERRRANNAERQRRFKERLKSAEEVTELTPDNAGNALATVTPPSLPPNENNSNPPTHTPVNNNPARKGVGRPEGVGEQVWTDFLAQRKAKRAPVTPTVIDGIRREAAKAGWTLEAALAETATRGWQSFKAHFVEDAPKPRNSAPTDYLDHYLARQGP